MLLVTTGKIETLLVLPTGTHRAVVPTVERSHCRSSIPADGAAYISSAREASRDAGTHSPDSINITSI